MTWTQMIIRGFAMIAGSAVLIAQAPAARYTIGPMVIVGPLGAGLAERSGPAPLPDSPPKWLPEGLRVCSSLGLGASDAEGCHLAGILDASARQTDPALWFERVSSTVGKPLESCGRPRAIQSYQTVAGTVGTTYLCQPPKMNDHIQDGALAALRSRAEQLNRRNPGTFGDHQAAKRIKDLIGFYGRPAEGAMTNVRFCRYVATVVLGLSGIVSAHGRPDPAFPFDLPPDLIKPEDVLPEGLSICSKLGLDPKVPGRCNSFAVLARAMKQADQSLWFSKTTEGAGPTCEGAVGFSRSESSGPITYLCPAPKQDMTITAEELRRLTAEAARLNAVRHKTLAEHLRAMDLKTEIDCVTGRQTQDCD